MTLEAKELSIPGVLELVPRKFGDARGFFSETFNQRTFNDAGIDTVWVQDNHSLSAEVGVVRGLHFQLPPFAQDKLVRVIRGRVLDVVVDIRKGSPSFGDWLGIELSAEKWNQLYVPKGFAHGFKTIEADCEVLYKVSAYYSAEHDRSVRFNDPDLGIDWKLDGAEPVISDKDRNAPFLKDADNSFVYGETG